MTSNLSNDELTLHIYQTLTHMIEVEAPSAEVISFLDSYPQWDVNSDFIHTGAANHYCLWFFDTEIIHHYLQRGGQLRIASYSRVRPDFNLKKAEEHILISLMSYLVFYSPKDKVINYLLDNYKVELTPVEQKSLYGQIVQLGNNKILRRLLTLCEKENITKELSLERYSDASLFRELSTNQKLGLEKVVVLRADIEHSFYIMLLERQPKLRKFFNKIWPVFLLLDMQMQGQEKSSNYCSRIIDTLFQSSNKEEIVFCLKEMVNFQSDNFADYSVEFWEKNNEYFLNFIEKTLAQYSMSYLSLINEINLYLCYEHVPTVIQRECEKGMVLPYKKENTNHFEPLLFVSPFALCILNHYNDINKEALFKTLEQISVEHVVKIYKDLQSLIQYENLTVPELLERCDLFKVRLQKEELETVIVVPVKDGEQLIKNKTQKI